MRFKKYEGSLEAKKANFFDGKKKRKMKLSTVLNLLIIMQF